MSTSSLDSDTARYKLHEIMAQDLSFAEKSRQALALGEEYLGVDDAYLTRIDPNIEHWKVTVSTAPSDGTYPDGLRFDLATTYCRRVISQNEPVALHDASEQGWEEDPAFETHGVHCYHGTAIYLDDDIYGTVCFASENPRDSPFTDAETLFAALLTRMLEYELQEQHLMDRIERLDQFASILSHDLRNPLNVAQGHLSIAAEETGRERIEIAMEELDRMESLIADVLTMARQGYTTDELEEISLESIAENCWQSVETSEADLIVETDLQFYADSNCVSQLFENLFANAIEHGGSEVTIRVGSLPGKEGFYVEDDGPGIPEVDRHRVFETGYSTGEHGIGLGLSIVEAIVSAHDWTIRITNARPDGARFEISDTRIPVE